MSHFKKFISGLVAFFLLSASVFADVVVPQYWIKGTGSEITLRSPYTFDQDLFTGSATWGEIIGTLSDQTDLQGELDGKEDSITAGTSGQYWRGDKTFQTLNATAVGLGNVTNVLQIPFSYLDTDITLSANSDEKVPSQKAIKTYTDSISQGLLPKNSVQVATVTAGTLASDFENGDTVDTATLATGQRILIKDQASAIENGIYTVNASGAPTRATDYDTDAEVVAGTFTYILDGGANENTQWVQYEATPQVGVDNINFRLLSSPETTTASAGIIKVLQDFMLDLADTNPALEIADGGVRVKVDDSSIERAAGGLQVKATGITNAMLAGSIADSKLSTISTVGKVVWAAVNKTGSSIADLDDVTVSSVADGECLVYDSGTSEWVNSTDCGSGSGGTSDYLYKEVVFHSAAGTNATWTNMPLAATELLGASTNRVKVNLTGAVQYRVVVTQATAGLAGADFNVQYSTNNSTYSALDTAAAGELDVGTGTGVKVGAWADMVAGGKQDVWLRIVGKDGDGIVDPAWRQIRVEFKVNSSVVDGGNTGTIYSEATIHSHPSSSVTWTNMPAAVTEFLGAATDRQKLDLSNSTEYRIVVYQQVAGLAGADLNVQYSLDGSSFSAADTTGAGELDVGTGTGIKYGSWATLVAGATDDVWIRVVGKQGDGVVDPQFRQVKIQFKQVAGLVGGTGTANAISYWEDTDTVADASQTTWDETLKRLGLGFYTDLSGTGRLTVSGENSADGAITQIVASSASANAGPYASYLRTRGTSAALEAVDSGDWLGGIIASGYGATGVNSPTGLFWAGATQDFTDSAAGTRFTMNVTPNNTVSSVVAQIWDQDSKIYFYNDTALYRAVNDGSPSVFVGSSAAERVGIQAVYNSGAQTLDYVKFVTDVASATANKGKFSWWPDGVNTMDFVDTGIQFLQDANVITIPTNKAIGAFQLVDSIGTSLIQATTTTGSPSLSLMGSATITNSGIALNDTGNVPFVTFNGVGDIRYSLADTEFIVGVTRAADATDADTIVGVVGQDGGTATVVSPNGRPGFITAMEGGSGSNAFTGGGGDGGNAAGAYVFGGAKGLKDGGGADGVDGDVFLGIVPNGDVRGNVYIGTLDIDGTPAIGRLVVQASTADGTTNAQVWRDSGNANIASFDSNGILTSAGITFGNEALANYDEGTFAPTVTLVGGAGNTVPVYSTNTGRFTRIGNRVFVSIYLTGDGGDEGAGSGTLTVALPVAANASFPTSYFPIGHFANGTAEDPIWGKIAGGAQVVDFAYEDVLNNFTVATGAEQNNTTRSVRLEFSYEL